MLSQSGPHCSPRYAIEIYTTGLGNEERWISTDCWDLQALEGKDVKDLLLNVGSGGGAAPAAAGAAASGDASAPAEEKKEEKEEGTKILTILRNTTSFYANYYYSQGGVRRGYGFRSFRLNFCLNFSLCTFKCMATVYLPSVQYWAGRVASINKQAFMNFSER